MTTKAAAPRAVTDVYEARVRTALAAMGATDVKQGSVCEHWLLPNGRRYTCPNRGADAKWIEALNNLRQAYGGLLPVVDDQATAPRKAATVGTTTKKLTDAEKSKIVELRRQGMTIPAIGKKIGRAKASVHRVLSNTPQAYGGLPPAPKKTDSGAKAGGFELIIRMPGGGEAKAPISKAQAEGLALKILSGDI